MDSTDSVLKKLRSCIPVLTGKYNVKQVGVFGSYVRNEQKEDSDLDILVDFKPEARFGLLTFIEMENYLSDAMGLKVDLVMKDGLKPRIGKKILDEVKYL
ncbi:MAG TPA: nucleotidyltransferase family protein [Spirochaetota bacterium]|nr:nucleotidyltransferase family protein [Spirochaetota bacterium]HPC40696.1 nucleotidyltransferase family protein [Spirochaetota bacterium]HPL18685.1 nucleotidyltransferase family protein [Spirochaetota bacterium]HQF09396.1 nucleotidyltransferase family protein [Spirochaetota bacterium]HQH97990.1 nucleotidyltransferase family protein [Spirochaetota bacterium]